MSRAGTRFKRVPVMKDSSLPSSNCKASLHSCRWSARCAAGAIGANWCSSPCSPVTSFVRVIASMEARVQILRTNGVVRVVGTRGQGFPIPNRQIEDLQRFLTNNIPIMDHPLLRIGQRVRIRGGCLDGVEGILLGRKGNQTLVVSVDAIERSLAIRLQGYNVESI